MSAVRRITVLLAIMIPIVGWAADLNKDLLKAAEKGKKDMVQTLLASGADINSRDKDCRTALMLAALGGHSDIVQLLLANDVDVDAKDKDGRTAVMLAAINARADVVQILLDSGAEINSKDRDGKTVWDKPNWKVKGLLNATRLKRELLTAVQGGDIQAVKTLLAKGVDANAKSRDQKTALLVAAESGNVDIVQALVGNNADVNQQNKDGKTALMLAAMSGFTNAVSILLEAGTDVNAKDKNGKTALILAEEQGRHDTAILLVKAGINQHLIVAVSRGDPDAVKAVLFEGADVNTKNRDGRTVLMLAVLGGHSEIAKTLLAKGAEAHIKDKYGATALELAVRANLLSIVQVLLSKEVNMSTKQQEAWTCLEIAESKGYNEIAQLFETLFQPQIVDTPNTYWLWKSSKPTSLYLVPVWRIEGSVDSVGQGMGALVLMEKLYAGDKRARELSIQSQVMSSLFGGLLSSGKEIATGYLEWPLFPNLKEDFFKLEQGTMDLGCGRLVRSPLTFSRHSDEVNIFSAGSPSQFVVFSPSIYVQPNSGFLVLSGTLTRFDLSDASISHSSSPIKHSDIVVIGRVRFPENKWMPVRKDLKIRGGGLSFESDGISFLPGTKILRDPNGKLGYTANLNQDLLIAAKSGDAITVKRLLTMGVDVNARDEGGLTALTLAENKGYPEIARLLKKALLIPNYPGGMSPADYTATLNQNLLAEAEKGNTITVQDLLEAGADLKWRNHVGRTALIAAAHNAHLDTVRFLLSRGASVNAGDQNGKTALMYAVTRGHTTTIKALLEAGADVNVQDSNGATAITLAAEIGNTEIVQLLKKPDVMKPQLKKRDSGVKRRKGRG